MNPMVGSLAKHGVVVEKVHRRIFLALKRCDSGEGVLELPGTKMGCLE